MIEEHRIIAVLKKVEFTHHTIFLYTVASSTTSFLKAEERLTPLNIDTFDNLVPELRKIYELSQNIEHEQLIQRFTKKKIGRKEFFNLKGSLIPEVVLPFVEQKIFEILQLLKKTGVPVYDFSGMPHFYDSDRYYFEQEKASTILSFERKEDGTSYRLEITLNQQKIKLDKSNSFILLNEPCCLIVDRRILFFEKGVSGKLILPFLTKEQIEIPKRLEYKYFNSFIRKVVNTAEIKASGFSIKEININPDPLLILEDDWQGQTCLVLKFQYGQRQLLSGNNQNVFTDLNVDENGFTFFRMKRNRDLEHKFKQHLTMAGLTLYSDCFKINHHEKEVSKYDYIEWLIENKSLLINNGFILQQESDREFVTESPIIRQSLVSSTDWFDVDIYIELGNCTIPFIKFKDNILNGNREYVLPDGRIFLIPAEWMSRYKELLIHGTGTNTLIRLQKFHFRLLKPFNFEEVKEFSHFENIESEVPQLCNVTLRPYQIKGFQWLYQLLEMGFGGILADDMGLGKTLQTIALLAKYYDHASRIADTIEKSSEDNVSGQKPTENGRNLHNNSSKPSTGSQLDLFNNVAEKDITTRIANSAHKQVNTYAQINASIIAMPASLIYNWLFEIKRFAPLLRVLVYVGSGRKFSRSILQNYDILLTTYGTLRNDIKLLSKYTFKLAILDESQFIKNPESKTTTAVYQLKSDYRMSLTGTPVENNLVDLWAQMNFANPGLLGTLSNFQYYYSNPLSRNPEDKQGKELLSLIQPFILRRTKKDVAPELPDLSETISYCNMTEEQQELYETEKSKVRNLVIDQLEKGALDTGTNPIMILKALMQLRQISNHPKLVEADTTSNSGKFDEITSKLDTLMAENHKVLIFSSFVKHLRLVEEYCSQKNYDYSLLTGSTTNREKVITDFKANKNVRVFLISLKAGGFGLNLTEADYVFIIDPWWNPAAEMQAINRAHRIGQHKNVFVYRFITKNSVEEKILYLQSKKKQLAETFIKPHKMIGKMTREEILQLFE